MIDKAYLEIIRDDLIARAKKGIILINNSVAVPVTAVAISTNLVAGIENAIALQVTTPHVNSVPVITSVKLLTDTGAVVAEKTVFIETNGAQFINLTFAIEVKGGQ